MPRAAQQPRLTRSCADGKTSIALAVPDSRRGDVHLPT
jgi:hypothetical protein